jgi:polyhydroxyalkanoate synthase subunit PhaC
MTLFSKAGRPGRLRHHAAQGKAHATPLIFVYALMERPFILDLFPGRSVMANLTRQGFDVYMVEWIPPARADSWRGFDAYVNQDLDDTVRAVQSLTDVSASSLEASSEAFR